MYANDSKNFRKINKWHDFLQKNHTKRIIPDRGFSY